MADAELRERWERTRLHLEAALDLAGADVAGVEDARDYLAHNELGLALDVLADIAADQGVPEPFWTAMAQAVETMGLDANDSVHGASVAIVRGHVLP